MKEELELFFSQPQNSRHQWILIFFFKLIVNISSERDWLHPRISFSKIRMEMMPPRKALALQPLIFRCIGRQLICYSSPLRTPSSPDLKTNWKVGRGGGGNKTEQTNSSWFLERNGPQQQPGCRAQELRLLVMRKTILQKSYNQAHGKRNFFYK